MSPVDFVAVVASGNANAVTDQVAALAMGGQCRWVFVMSVPARDSISKGPIPLLIDGQLKGCAF
jgi:hypothetical protein